MRCIGNGTLAVLMVAGVACSDVTGGMPTGMTRQGITASYVAGSDLTIAEPAAGFGLMTVCGTHAGYPGGASRRSCLMRWPINPASNVTVTAASLDLRVTDAASQAVNIFPLKRGWLETQGTWTHVHSEQPWQVPGAKGVDDRGPLAGTPVFSQTGDAVYQFNSTGVQMVQSWFAGQNYGLIFEEEAADRVQFATREDPTPEFRPTLNVTVELGGTGGGFPIPVDSGVGGSGTSGG